LNCEDNENTCPSKNPTAEVGKIEKSKSEVARNRQDRPSFADSRAYDASGIGTERDRWAKVVETALQTGIFLVGIGISRKLLDGS
tara:strand:+ start:173 stop:427 length:255 start_codon:yes stop_codon:yes gene_type:complete